jgi:hypothetical protein
MVLYFVSQKADLTSGFSLSDNLTILCVVHDGQLQGNKPCGDVTGDVTCQVTCTLMELERRTLDLRKDLRKWKIIK